MPFILFQNPGYFQNIANGVGEEDKGKLIDLFRIVVDQLFLQHGLDWVDITNFDDFLVFVVQKTEANILDRVLRIIKIELPKGVLNHIKEKIAVLFIDKTVIKYPQHLMNPQI